MRTLDQFSQFGNYMKGASKIVSINTKGAIIYTRVSSKEQAENNLSLDFQRKTVEDYAQKQGLPILGYFGGTYESAKTDGRKEFLRMLDFIKKYKGKVSHILVYTLDRFSRTGGGAIKLAQDLREKHGVTVFAVTQPTDTSNPSGVLHQNIQLLFSEFDNQLRKQRAIAGMKEKFEKGEWVTRVPQGYDIIKINGVRKIVINKEGKLIRKAFEWKSQGMKNEEIIERLNAQGMKMYKQQLVKIFKKPFYCGIINHGLLNGKVIEGNHPKLISQELFLKVNNINISSHQYGVPHKKEREQVPLKVFMKCEDCGQPFAGYIVKKKNLWYYKCRTKGCKCNRSAKEMNIAFVEYLEKYMPDEKLLEPLQLEFEHLYYKINEEKFEEEKRLNEQLKEVNKKIDTIEEKFFVLNEMSKEAFDKFYPKYQKERVEIGEQLQNSTHVISNLSESISKILSFSSKLNTVWTSRELKVVEGLQKLIFPQGIYYDKKTREFRTEKVNVIFLHIASVKQTSEGNKKGTNHFLSGSSLSADRTGLEPATSAVTGRHSNQLNYRSFSVGAAKIGEKIIQPKTNSVLS
jgi:site-specific DNA recombinase